MASSTHLAPSVVEYRAGGEYARRNDKIDQCGFVDGMEALSFCDTFNKNHLGNRDVAGGGYHIIRAP